MRGKNNKSKNSSRVKKRPRPAWEGEDEDEDEEHHEGGYEDDNVVGGATHESIHDDEEAARIVEDLDHDREHSTHDENPRHTNLDDVASSPDDEDVDLLGTRKLTYMYISYLGSNFFFPHIYLTFFIAVDFVQRQIESLHLGLLSNINYLHDALLEKRKHRYFSYMYTIIYKIHMKCKYEVTSILIIHVCVVSGIYHFYKGL